MACDNACLFPKAHRCFLSVSVLKWPRQRAAAGIGFQIERKVYRGRAVQKKEKNTKKKTIAAGSRFSRWRMTRNWLLFLVLPGGVGFLMLRFFSTIHTMASSYTYTAGSNSIAYVTAPNVDLAKEMASGLVEQKLAACVNIVPRVISVYEWENKINTDEEVLMMIKTSTDRVPDIVKYIKSKHTYEVPEVISLPIENGYDAYLKWVTNNSKGK